MEVNPYLLNKILEDQKKAWALLERWVVRPAFQMADAELLKETIEYLTPIRKGLLEIQQKLAKAQEVPVIKNPNHKTAQEVKGMVEKLSELSGVDLMFTSEWDATQPCKHCSCYLDSHVSKGNFKNMCPGVWMPGCRPFYEPKNYRSL